MAIKHLFQFDLNQVKLNTFEATSVSVTFQWPTDDYTIQQSMEVMISGKLRTSTAIP